LSPRTVIDLFERADSLLSDVRKASESIVLFLLLSNLELLVLREILQGLFCSVFGGDKGRRDSLV